MRMAKRNRVLDDLAVGAPLRARFKAALALLGSNVTRWAEEHGRRDSEVWMTLSGTRIYPEIRDDIAAVLGITREQLDAEIAAERSAKEGVA